MAELKSRFTECYDSPWDFVKCMLITLAIIIVWGLFMGLMGEYR